MAVIEVRTTERADAEELARMRFALWPDSSFEEHRAEVEAWLDGVTGTLPVTILLAGEPGERPIGFLEVGLRSHADGCSVTQPVGFVEGWFVEPEWRGQGVGGLLIAAAEVWARERGCLEMASDALIDNEASIAAHQALGFEVGDRCVHLRKTL